MRALLLDPAIGDIHPRTEALLMAADRAQHVAEVIRPLLDAGQDVISDRYVGSSMAYQAGGRQLDAAEIRRLSSWATDDLAPDLVLLLDVPPAVSAARIGARPDRFERAGEEFHRRVASAFRAEAAADPLHWCVIDGSGTIDEVSERIDAAIADRLGAPR